MRVRPYADADLPTVLGLVNETFSSYYEFIPFTEQGLVSRLRDPTVNAFVVEDGEIHGFGALAKRPWGEEVEFLCPRRDDQSKEVEALLLDQLEEVSRSGKLTIVVDDDDARIRGPSRRGYRARGGLYHVVRELAHPEPIPPVPTGFVLRSLRPDEEAALIRLVNSVYGFRRLEQGVLTRWATEDPDFSAEWIHVAEFAGRLVAAVCSRRDLQYNHYYNAKRGYLGPAATHRSFKRRGLARALTVRAMNFFLSQGLNTASLYTLERNLAARAVLTSLGFTPRHHWKFLRKSVVRRRP